MPSSASRIVAVDEAPIRAGATRLKPRMKTSCATTHGAYAIAVTSRYSITSRLYSWNAASTISVTERARSRRSDMVLFDGDRLGEVARLVDVEATLHGDVVRQKLKGNHRQDGVQHVFRLWNPDLVIDQLLEHLLLLARDRDDSTPSRLHLLNVRDDFIEH